jgi:DNA-binding NarL/FixJ family response regulator
LPAEKKTLQASGKLDVPEKPFVAAIRTVMVTTPAMLGDLIKRLAVGRVQLDVIAEVGGRRALKRRLHQLHPDLVVIGLHRSESIDAVTELLESLPKTKFIAVLPNGRITGYELQLRQTHLSDLSPEALIDFISSGYEEPAP